MRDHFLDKFSNKSTRSNYVKAFNKLDSFLQQRQQTEEQFILEIKNSENHNRYELLQELVNHIKESVSPVVCRLYFDCLFKYFLIQGSPLDFTQKKIRVNLPRVKTRIYDGLDRDSFLKLIELSSFKFGLYMKFLAGSGSRETEGLRVTPSMFRFEEFPTRVLLSEEITKYNIARETFLPTNTSKLIQNLIIEKGIKLNETIFTDNWTKDTLIDFEKYFNGIRTKAGLETQNREKNQKNDITLHSCRAFFITTFTDNGQHDIGHALAGHSKYLEVYYRKSLKERQTIFSSIMQFVDF